VIYPYSFVSTHAAIAAAFLEQFCIQGAFGVIPVHLLELSPGSFRVFVIGTAYQLGNFASSVSSTIEATIGEHFRLPPTAKGVKRYDYGKVICIFVGCSFGYVVILTLVGPGKKGVEMDVLNDSDAVAAIAGGDVKKISAILHVDQEGHDDLEIAGTRRQS
jgi:SHS family lactate transporter-like MFS transporter